MGYHVSTIFSVSPNDKHSYFIYHIPSQSFEFKWIDDWLEENFKRIAESVGPSGVIISPHENKGEEFIESILEINGGGCIFCSASDSNSSGVLHAGFPFLIISRIPLQNIEDNADVIMINLAGCKEKGKLGLVFDVIVRVVKEDNWNLLDTIPLQKPVKYPSNWAFALNEAIELKPNFFGVGIDLNSIFKIIGEKVIKKHK